MRAPSPTLFTLRQRRSSMESLTKSDARSPALTPERPSSNGKPSAVIVGIAGIGSYVPELVLTNADLERMVDTSDEWITTRTGIAERRIAGAGEATSDMAVAAARRALDDAGLEGESIDLVIVATVTPDHPFPAVSPTVQDVIGA